MWERTKRRCHFPDILLTEFWADHLHMQKYHFDGRQNDTWVHMLKLRNNPFTDMLRFLDILRLIFGQRGKNCDATPSTDN